MITPQISTKRLTLRKHVQEDIVQLQDILSDPEVMKLSGLDIYYYKKNAEAEQEWFKQLENSDNGIRWIITYTEDSLYLGDLGFLDIDKMNHRAEISYKLSRKQWNKGMRAQPYIGNGIASYTVR